MLLMLFSDSELMFQTTPCVRDAPLRWWRVDSMCADVGNVSLRPSAYSLFAHWMVPQCSISKTRHYAKGVKTLCELTWEWNASALRKLFFCACSDSGMSRSFLTSTLSSETLRQPVGEKCFYSSTAKFSIALAKWQNTLPIARELREERTDEMMPLNGHLSSPRQRFRFS